MILRILFITLLIHLSFYSSIQSKQKDIDASWHSLKINSDSYVSSWGYNSTGQLGDGSLVSRVAPVSIQLTNKISSVQSGELHTLLLDKNKNIYSTGYNYFGQLGLGDNTYRSKPELISSLNNVIDISAGGYHSGAVVSKNGSNELYMWGYNGSAQLGDGTIINRKLPIQIFLQNDDLTFDGPQEISLGHSHSLVLTTEGTIWGWGYNGYGQLGFPSEYFGGEDWIYEPLKIEGFYDVISISTNGYHTLALKEDGTVWGWGNNSQGQIGNRYSFDTHEPMAIEGLPPIVKIAAGYNHSLALDIFGDIWAWGGNENGQLGDGLTYNSRNSPEKVMNLNEVVEISAGDKYSLAIKNDASDWSWGKNYNGQLGDGTKIDKYLPVEVLNESVFITNLQSNSFYGDLLKIKPLGCNGSSIYCLLNINAVINNSGTEEIPLPIVINIYLSSDEFLDESDLIMYDHLENNTSENGYSLVPAESVNYNLIKRVTKKDYELKYLVLKIDPDNLINETSEDDNLVFYKIKNY